MQSICGLFISIFYMCACNLSQWVFSHLPLQACWGRQNGPQVMMKYSERDINVDFFKYWYSVDC